MNSITANPAITSRDGAQRNKGSVNPKILSCLKKSCGEEEPIANIYDKRVMTLRDTILFEKGCCEDPEALLGEKWLEAETCDKDREFYLKGANNTQRLTFDSAKKRVYLRSTHSLWGGIMGETWQTIIMRRDGVVSQ